mmetsp:Transcript_38132/g.61485  ORF Transcript_38132/g.61485 Transcript_38132/m.61485 type:complete len:236 (-) Transcript_38132:249-956(-)
MLETVLDEARPLLNIHTILAPRADDGFLKASWQQGQGVPALHGLHDHFLRRRIGIPILVFIPVAHQPEGGHLSAQTLVTEKAYSSSSLVQVKIPKQVPSIAGRQNAMRVHCKQVLAWLDLVQRTAQLCSSEVGTAVQILTDELAEPRPRLPILRATRNLGDHGKHHCQSKCACCCSCSARLRRIGCCDDEDGEHDNPETYILGPAQKQRHQYKTRENCCQTIAFHDQYNRGGQQD